MDATTVKDPARETLERERDALLSERAELAAKLAPIDDRLRRLHVAIAALDGSGDAAPSAGGRRMRAGSMRAAILAEVSQTRGPTRPTHVQNALVAKGYEIGSRSYVATELRAFAIRGLVRNVGRGLYEAVAA